MGRVRAWLRGGAALALAACGGGGSGGAAPEPFQADEPAASAPPDAGAATNDRDSGLPPGAATPEPSAPDAATPEPSAPDAATPDASTPPSPAEPQAAEPGDYRAGDFVVRILAVAPTPRIEVAHVDEPDHVLFDTPASTSFVVAAVGRERVESEFASFEVSDEVIETCGRPSLDSVERPAGDSVVLRGMLQDCGVPYTLRFAQLGTGQLGFRVQLDSARHNRVFLSYGSRADERFWGFGQQYSRLNLKGELLPIWVQEQGHGRGLEPLSTALGTVAGGAAGEWFTTYTAVPFYLSNLRRALMLENTEYLEFDMRQAAHTTIRVFSSELRGRIYYGAEPLDLLEAHTVYTGRMQPLPKWTQDGAIVRAYAGEESVLGLVDQLEAAGIPLAGLWVEDWMGRRKNLTGTRLWWNWQLDPTIYPNWTGFVRGLRERGIRVLTYFNPYLADSRSNDNHARYLFQEAEARDYLVEDGSGEVFTFGAGGFDGAIVDLTHGEAREWLKDIMAEHLATGVSGWMADFGEALPYDARLASGESAARYHNLWPVEWAKVNREVVAEAGLEGDALFWTRSGGTQTPAHTLLAWLGDQTVTWDRYDGMKTVVNALVAASLSGATLIHGDIGGYLSVTYPIVRLRRTKELLFRWVELGAFQALFRTHDSINPEDNPQIYSDAESLAHFARFAKLYTALAPYREQLMVEATERGYPLIRHPYLHYPDDPALAAREFQFMLGADFMVAPVLDPDVDRLEVYLPAGRWVHVWTGDVYGSAAGGGTYQVPAPIGSPPFFFPEGSAAGADLVERMDDLGLR